MDPKKSVRIAALAGLVREGLDLRVPIDVADAIFRLGGIVREVEGATGISPAVRRAGERFEITIRRNPLSARKRYLLAHELGHLFLHMGYLVSPETWYRASEYGDSHYYRLGYSIEEEEANHFALAFLMPAGEFRKTVRELADQGNVSVKELASHFKTSVGAVLRRGQELGVLRVTIQEVNATEPGRSGRRLVESPPEAGRLNSAAEFVRAD